MNDLPNILNSAARSTTLTNVLLVLDTGIAAAYALRTGSIVTTIMTAALLFLIAAPIIITSYIRRRETKTQQQPKQTAPPTKRSALTDNLILGVMLIVFISAWM